MNNSMSDISLERPENKQVGNKVCHERGKKKKSKEQTMKGKEGVIG